MKWTAEKVAALRRRLGLNQIDFASRLGINQAGLSRIEHGKREVSATLAVALDCMHDHGPKEKKR